MKEKILTFIKSNTRRIQIILASIAFLLALGNHTWWTKPDTDTTIQTNKPSVDFSFDMNYQDCMFNSKICDPQERHATCIGKTK